MPKRVRAWAQGGGSTGPRVPGASLTLLYTSLGQIGHACHHALASRATLASVPEAVDKQACKGIFCLSQFALCGRGCTVHTVLGNRIPPNGPPQQND